MSGIHQLRNIGLGVFQQNRFGRNLNAGLGTGYREVHVKIDILADRENNAGRLVICKSLLGDRHAVSFRRNEGRGRENALSIGLENPPYTLGLVRHDNHGTGNGRLRRVHDHARNAAETGPGLAECIAGKNTHQHQ